MKGFGSLWGLGTRVGKLLCPAWKAGVMRLCAPGYPAALASCP